jgi:hypothetical protein
MTKATPFFTLCLAVASLKHAGTLAFQAGPGSSVAIQSSTVDVKRLIKHERKLSNGAQNSLIPLSAWPLILVSSQPLLTEDECSIISHYCQQNLSPSGTVEMEETFSRGAQILQRTQHFLDDILARPCGEAPVLPRYLTYTSSDAPIDSVEALLPDGLHVDTNNGFLFRYLTVLLYLTDCDSSATTFPLAKSITTVSKSVSNREREAELLLAAEELLDTNTHHTGFDERDTKCRQIDEAAWHVYKRNEASSFGFRVLPRQGYITAFFGIAADGSPDPRSWHGAEALEPGEKKDILTFFYEVPFTFSSKNEFARLVGERKQALLERHGLFQAGNIRNADESRR